MTPFPAPNRLHVWWAQRPLVAARAAVLASLLPADADREKFLHVIGIHGDPVAAKRRIAEATRTGERLGADAYGYSRAFGYAPTEREKEWLAEKGRGSLAVDHPTAVGIGAVSARSNTLLATEVVPFPLSLVRLLATSVHEDAHQGHESCDECHQTRDIPARVQQHAADADDEENHDEAENLTPSLGRDLLGNDPRFKRASVGCLCFGHRHDPIRTAGEDRLVSFKRFRGRNRSLEVLDGCVLNRERAGWPVRRFCRHHGLGRLSVRLAGSHLPAHARSPSSRPRDPLR